MPGRLPGAVKLATCLVLAGCFSPQLSESPHCGPDDVCPDGFACAEGACVSSNCVGVANEAVCATSSIADGVCVGERCVPRGCGDGIVVDGELCDDGNRVNGDGCNASCSSDESCGNRIADVGEQCDDGNAQLSGDGCSAGCTVEFDVWTELHPLQIRHEVEPAFTYDEDRKVFVRFGGRGATTNLTWEWNGIGWRLRSPLRSPPPRWSASMTYEASRDRVLLFGGSSVGGLESPLNDTWAWDGNQWRDLAPAHSPPRRVGAAIAYDRGRDRTVLFGGVADASGTTGFTDTWEWNGGDWEQRSPTTRPPGGSGSAAYDRVRGRVVLLASNGTAWEWNGTNWTTAPAPPSSGRLTYDVARQRVVKAGDPVLEFDGATWAARGNLAASLQGFAYDEARSALVALSDRSGGPVVYERAAAVTAWQERVPPTFVLTAAGGAYDARRGRIVTTMFSAADNTTTTWELDGTSWFPVASAPGWRMGMVYDAERAVMLGFGGTVGASTSLTGTWTWDGTAWTNRSVTSPSTQSNPVLAFEGARQRVVMATRAASGIATWAWNGEVWAQLGSISTSASPTAMAYDEIEERIILLATSVVDQTYMLVGDTWTQLAPQLRLPALERPAMVYDATRRAIVVHGGRANVDLIASTWVFSHSLGWVPAQPIDSFVARYSGVAAYDQIRRRVVVSGGTGSVPRNLGTWFLASTSNAAVERCVDASADDDGDGLAGCADPDCWGRCAPSCPPSVTCDQTRPRCGDAVCNSYLEDYLLCPEDCS